jgi:hypothetical protein
MRGGGVGFFDGDGRPQPTAGNKTEEGITSLANTVRQVGLSARVRDDPAGFRLLSVSMCDHDIYSGGDQPDPSNPNRQPDGSGRSANGLFATKAAIQYVTAKLPTSRTFLHGTSAGSFGAFSVAYGLERQGVPLAGAVAEARQARAARRAHRAADAGVEPGRQQPVRRDPVLSHARWHDADARLRRLPPRAPARRHRRRGPGEPLAQPAPVRQPARRRAPGSCAKHSPTTDNLTNTDPAEAADYNGAIMTWVRARVGDP